VIFTKINRNRPSMADLPALNLFEEIQGLSNSMDFYSYNTKEDLSKTWSLYDDDETITESRKNPSTPTFSGKSSPTRDTWDPMLYNISLTTYLEIRPDDEVQIRKQPVLETPLTPLPGVEDLQVFLNVTQSQLELPRSFQQQHYLNSLEMEGRFHHLQSQNSTSCSSAFRSEKSQQVK